MKPKHLVVASIAAKNYLPRARVLAASLREQHPELQLHVLLSDQLAGEIVPADEPYGLVPLSSLGLVDEQQFCFRYDLRQRSSALKPFYLEYLLDQGYSAVLFLDPDMLVTAPLTPLLEPLRNSPILLTPHLLSPASDTDGVQRELEILQAGIFNAGVIGLAESPVARRFLAWWKQRLNHHTQDSVAEGMYYDQRWLDVVPSLFAPVHIVRDAGCNVAHWNLNERLLTLNGQSIQVNGRPCRLLHFSGYNPEVPEQLSHHADWLAPAENAPIRTLMAHYRQLLQQAGQSTATTWQLAWQRFANDLPIAPVLRMIYAASNTGQWHKDPFNCSESSFFHWLMQPADEQRPIITNLWLQLSQLRPELRARWPAPLGSDRERFAAWIRREGWEHYGLAPYQA